MCELCEFNFKRTQSEQIFNSHHTLYIKVYIVEIEKDLYENDDFDIFYIRDIHLNTSIN